MSRSFESLLVVVFFCSYRYSHEPTGIVKEIYFHSLTIWSFTEPTHSLLTHNHVSDKALTISYMSYEILYDNQLTWNLSILYDDLANWIGVVKMKITHFKWSVHVYYTEHHVENVLTTKKKNSIECVIFELTYI